MHFVFKCNHSRDKYNFGTNISLAESERWLHLGGEMKHTQCSKDSQIAVATLV